MKPFPLRGTVNYERKQPEVANEARSKELPGLRQNVQKLQEAEPLCKSVSGEETNESFCW